MKTTDEKTCVRNAQSFLDRAQNEIENGNIDQAIKDMDNAIYWINQAKQISKTKP
jgi:uncharacterized protein (UPF0332 family)